MSSEARCEPGWGALRMNNPPTPPLISFASTLPLQGG